MGKLNKLRDEPGSPLEQTIDRGFELIRNELALRGSAVEHAIVTVRASNMRPDTAVMGFDMHGPLDGREVLGLLLGTAHAIGTSLGIDLRDVLQLITDDL